MVKYQFKDICAVPNADSFIDIMLSRTNRQTPTIVRSKWKISSIRQFYMRKVRYTQQNISTRLTKIIEEFPKLDSIHPFYADLINVLYDRDHYKLALGQINVARTLVNNIGRDHIKLLKYGDSLYRCKALKVAALGRMVKVIKQQKASLSYLEQVRQHISRLPNIDPHTRTLILTGFPNVGKSSFMNKVTHANVEVQDYAFTTKSLYIGHTDYNYQRYQVIDSPGLLDRNLDERNTIEMQSITALAHLNACIIYFIDLSPLCKYSISNQCQLFNSLYPLFNHKPILIVCNKIDLRKIDELDKNDQMEIAKLHNNHKNIKIMQMSNNTQINVDNVKNEACEMLLTHRIEAKANVGRLETIDSRLFIAMPIKRDNKERPFIIPDIVKKQRELKRLKKKRELDNNNNNNDDDDNGDDDDDDDDDKNDENMRRKNKSLKDIENENGGPGVFSFDQREHWDLENEEWKYDPIPEIYNGKNIADFYTHDVEHKLNILEEEENKNVIEDIKRDIEMSNPNHEDPDQLNSDDELLYKYINRKQILSKQESSRNKHIRNVRPVIARSDRKIPITKLQDELQDLGINTNRVSRRIQHEHDIKQDKKLQRDGSLNKLLNNSNQIEQSKDLQAIARAQSKGPRSKSASQRQASKERSRSRSKSKQPEKGVQNTQTAIRRVHSLKMTAIKQLQKLGRNHESDRHVMNMKPKHLNSGKRNLHKADWR